MMEKEEIKELIIQTLDNLKATTQSVVTKEKDSRGRKRKYSSEEEAKTIARQQIKILNSDQLKDFKNNIKQRSIDVNS
ncbi:MAG: hypothetical protein EZS28_019099 [Streblomastix strix]|uniref:Uncharacterized protein n=1 Tax=Streblomastix strix TaxID=222440 RepID=A0A5J4VSR5_9EUKA|nr:MAG: hypothetical protein EZS28_019099 [Streblomastix strix]